jgi:glycopeptide antibiotics resistance protein
LFSVRQNTNQVLGQWAVLFFVEETCGLATIANTACAPDTMDIIVNGLGHVIVDDMTDILDIWKKGKML